MGNLFSDTINNWALRRAYSVFNVNQSNTITPTHFNGIVGLDKPAWVSLSSPEHYELAARKNPIVASCIKILARSAANAEKVAVDINTGEVILWNDKRVGIQKAYSLLSSRPNPAESAKEFETRGITYLKTFGNRYVRVLMPLGFDSEIDLMNVSALYNLPSQNVHVKTTGKIYDQTTLEGMISEYALSQGDKVKTYSPNEIIQFNEVNISTEFPTIMGISSLEACKDAIETTTLAMLAGANLLQNGGMQGIISPTKKAADGGTLNVTPEETLEQDKKAKEYYGLQKNQMKLWFSQIPMEFLKTALTAKELGIYEAISNGALLISSVLGVPYELVKADLGGTTYENQSQSVKRLYQDTTIPDVQDWDSYWSFRLQTEKYGFRIESRWSHIEALQEGFKDKAIALYQNTKSADLAWTQNQITRNQYLKLIEQPSLEGKDGDMYKVNWDKKIGLTENTTP